MRGIILGPGKVKNNSCMISFELIPALFRSDSAALAPRCVAPTHRVGHSHAVAAPVLGSPTATVSPLQNHRLPRHSGDSSGLSE